MLGWLRRAFAWFGFGGVVDPVEDWTTKRVVSSYVPLEGPRPSVGEKPKGVIYGAAVPSRGCGTTSGWAGALSVPAGLAVGGVAGAAIGAAVASRRETDEVAERESAELRRRREADEEDRRRRRAAENTTSSWEAPRVSPSYDSGSSYASCDSGYSSSSDGGSCGGGE